MTKGYRKDEITEALEWFGQGKNFESTYRNCINGGTEEFFTNDFLTDKNQPYRNAYYNDKFKGCEADSSPLAWEHYIRHYTPETFGQTKNTYQDKNGANQGIQNYSFEGLKYSGIRIFAVPQAHALNLDSKGVINNSERLGGDCDFNFNNIRKLRGAKTAFHQFAEMLCDDIIEEKENQTTKHKEALLKKNVNLEQEVKDQLELLEKCRDMHHTLLNFSLMQGTGNLQGIKQRFDCDRLDAFLNYLNEYYKTNSKKQIEKLQEKKQTHYEKTENLKVLQYYLNQFSRDSSSKEIPADECIYNYCAKIYFLPTEGYPTGMMAEMSKETFERKEWSDLFTNNENLIKALLALGEQEFKKLDSKNENDKEYNHKLAIDHMLLAVHFWQAKETYFKLMDKELKKKASASETKE